MELFYHRLALFSPILLYLILSYLFFTKVPLVSDYRSEFQRIHLTGVRLEMDGNINIKYRQEVLLGEGEFAKRDDDSPQVLLKAIFTRADKDLDGFLSDLEIFKWIQAKVEQHINQAIAENYITFADIDLNPRDGRVTWDEYHNHFMKKIGVIEEQNANHRSIHSQLNRKVQETIMFDKAAWEEAVKLFPEQPGNVSSLSVSQFLSFRHPESSNLAILRMSSDLLNKFDLNSDNELSEDEFVKRPGTAEEVSEAQSNDRKFEFYNIIDENRDGQVQSSELMRYIDPKNPRHAKLEAKFLIESADKNKDSKLSLEEILSNVDLFIGSKMVDAGKSFHDEF